MRTQGWSIVVTLLLGIPAAGMAQSVVPSGTGEVMFELGASGGAGLGLDSLAAETADALRLGLQLGGASGVSVQHGPGIKWLLGAHGGVRVAPNVLVIGEVLINRVAQADAFGTVSGQPFSLSATATLQEYTGGIRYVLSRGAVAPYARAAFGVVRVTANTESPQLPGPISVSDMDLTWNAGGGVHFGSGLGVRPDVRLVRIPDRTFLRTSVAIVYQVR